VHDQGVLFDEEGFVEALNDMPVWARLWEGNYLDEEVEEIKPRYLPKAEHLAQLYKARLERQEERMIEV